MTAISQKTSRDGWCSDTGIAGASSDQQARSYDAQDQSALLIHPAAPDSSPSAVSAGTFHEGMICS